MAAHQHLRPQPVCPLHPGSRVTFDGVYGRQSRKRQRFRCVPGDGADAHVFTELVPRTLAPAGEECWECERPLDRHEGPPAPRGYEYTVREIAEALILVGRGSSFAAAGREVRALSERPRRRSSRHRRRREDSRTVGSWVEVFTPPLWQALRPSAWPEVVALDAKPFYVGGRTNAEGELVQGGTPVFHVFAAMGYDSYDGPVRLVGLRSFPNFALHQGRPYWIEFLRELKQELAGAPRQFVCDADPDIEQAIRTVWPQDTPEVFLCHHHLTEALLRAVERSVGRRHELYAGAAEALKDSPSWAAFVEAAASHRPQREVRPLSLWLRRNSAQIAYQLAHRVGHVVDTAAAEQYLDALSRQLGFRRASIRNRHRLDLTLRLMLLQQRQPARRSRYAHIIREFLLSRERGKPPRQRRHDDQDGRGSLRLPRRTGERPQPPPPEPPLRGDPPPFADDGEIPF